MIDALDLAMPAIRTMGPDQLRIVIAHAAGLHAHVAGHVKTAAALANVLKALGRLKEGPR
jgi:hypothetical protein